MLVALVWSRMYGGHHVGACQWVDIAGSVASVIGRGSLQHTVG